MQRTAFPIVLALLVVAACGKKDDDKPAPTDKPATPVAPAAPEPETLPSTWPKLEIPADNPQSAEKIALGHQLFFEPRLSVDGTRSCYSCHQNEHGNGGETALAVGAKEVQLTRHSPVIWDMGYLTAFYWDGRAATLEAQAKGAWGGGNMGVGADNLDAKAAEIGKIAGYAEQFAKVFPEKGATADTVAQAIAAYERTLLCKDTAYDKYAAGDINALDAAQKRGLALFVGKAQCTACHAPPTFTVAMGTPGGAYFNIGIGTQATDESNVDVGRMKVSGKETDWAAFKVPSLRNASKSAPYFHDGSVETLKEAVELMAKGGINNKNKSKLVSDRELSDTEIDDLVTFLGALECGNIEAPTLPE